ncbi:TonB-dependent receptor [Persicobacter diffluens]|uniref:SusC/RagA family TonB-linked outer membrane protein n=1 Tax=Persicobacter diffluens TaxID=981 RepID=A0AAN4W5A9_9BACT|nr:SusC/RagA family TonB-linked outer membrane protein [Persicobacter diffluens]
MARYIFFLTKAHLRLMGTLPILFLLLFNTHVYGQNRTISGVVMDADGPIPGVNIQLEGTTIGTMTDFEGRYEVNLRDQEDPILIYKFVGYKTVREIVGNRNTIDVSLEMDVQELEELVVIGYGEVKKKDLTGAVGMVETEDLTQFPVSDVSNALEGRVAGVFVSSTSEPGGVANMNIRGIGSVNGNSNPLFVVDGIQMDNISGINPNDIENMQVLKDASSAAIYGSRAANGVVLITTKSGKSGEQKISVNLESGVSQVSNSFSMMNTDQYAQYTRDLFNNASTPQFPQSPPAWVEDPAIMATNTDWQNEVFKPGTMTKADFSISGGNDHGTYRASLGYINQSGTIDNSGFERINLSINSKQKRGALTFGIASNMFISDKESSKLSANSFSHMIYTAAPQMPVYDPNNLNGFGAPSIALTGQNNTPNPMVGSLYENTTKRYGIMSNIYAEFNIIKGLDFRTDVNTNFVSRNNQEYNPIIDQGSAGALNERSNYLNKVEDTRFDYNVESYFKFNRTFGDHSINAMAGGTLNVENLLGTQISATNIEEGTMVPQTGNVGTAYGFNRTYRLASVLGRVNYSFKDRYLFTASFRRDGSSRFVNNKWGSFPSFSAGWRISDEPFMKGLTETISNLKLRAGYGELGGLGGNSMPVLNNQILYPFPSGGYQGVAPIELSNPNLTWERVQQTNIGLDMGFWDDRILLTGEYFIRNSHDMLMQSVNPGYSGIRGDNWVNLGSMTNKGVEMSITFNHQSDNGLKQSVTFNTTLIRNEVTELPESYLGGVTNEASHLVVGQPIGVFYGYVRDGLNPITGTQMFRDVNGDFEVNGEDREVLGSPHPTYYLGLNYNASYKGFDFSIFLQGAGGHQLYNMTKQNLEGTSSYGNRLDYVNDRAWREDNPNGTLPRITAKNESSHPGITNDVISDRWIEDAAYLRVKNIQIGYTFPQALQDRWGTNNLRVYVSGIDLFTFTNYSGLDPSFVSSYSQSFQLGYDNTGYPPVRSFTAGLQLSF